MYRIAILGCENSHADAFLNLIIKEKKYPDIEVVGVYSNEAEALERMKASFGVYCADSFDEFVGKVDGIVITARDGRNHYKYAKPYIKYGIPMFVDKPITSDENEALEFMKELRDNGCKVVGGSSCVHSPLVKELAEKRKSGEYGKVYGGFLRAPINLVNNYGNFFFYSQHLVQVMQTIFGYYPKSVKTYQNGDVITLSVRYDEYDVSAQFTGSDWTYIATVSHEKGLTGGIYPVNESLYPMEFDEFYHILHGGEQPQSYKEFASPVPVLCAIERAIESGREETVRPMEEI